MVSLVRRTATKPSPSLRRGQPRFQARAKKQIPVKQVQPSRFLVGRYRSRADATTRAHSHLSAKGMAVPFGRRRVVRNSRSQVRIFRSLSPRIRIARASAQSGSKETKTLDSIAKTAVTSACKRLQKFSSRVGTQGRTPTQRGEGGTPEDGDLEMK